MFCNASVTPNISPFHSHPLFIMPFATLTNTPSFTISSTMKDPSSKPSTSSAASFHFLDQDPHLAAQASTNYKEAFSLFDKRGTGRVPADALGDLLRACGQNPTLAEITDLEKGVGKECTWIPAFSAP